jgi:hypothetical protein
MKKVPIALLGLALTSPSLPASVDLSSTGIEWTEGIQAAMHRGKPILHLQLLGRLDDAMC